ncbi:hypothetical protein [Agromyces sp. NPDC058064]|uniref:hypothetical protein n=1 Tax=Agromyces sp. NPDC058064 TaxID=3346322 RepID=UPI0036D7FEFB
MPFEAKYAGRCDDCRLPIRIGQEVEYKGLGEARRLVHVVCDEPGDDQLSNLDRDAKRETCPECFLLKPCVCGVF